MALPSPSQQESPKTLSASGMLKEVSVPLTVAGAARDLHPVPLIRAMYIIRVIYKTNQNKKTRCGAFEKYAGI